MSDKDQVKVEENIKKEEKWEIKNHLIVNDSYVQEGMH